MSVSEKEFQAYAEHISNEVKDSDGRTYSTWTVPAQFNSCLSLVIVGIWNVIELCGLIESRMNGNQMSNFLYKTCFQRVLQTRNDGYNIYRTQQHIEKEKNYSYVVMGLCTTLGMSLELGQFRI